MPEDPEISEASVVSVIPGSTSIEMGTAAWQNKQEAKVEQHIQGHSTQEKTTSSDPN